jgi:branched-chain amino acid transport system substrate-binding protein
MAQTGALAGAGKQALLGAQIWEKEINAKGGLLGRPVKLVYYDDQSNPATVPGIYAKLLDIACAKAGADAHAGEMSAAPMPAFTWRRVMRWVMDFLHKILFLFTVPRPGRHQGA